MLFKAGDEWRVEPYNEVRVDFQELRKKQRLLSRCASFKHIILLIMYYLFVDIVYSLTLHQRMYDVA
jgi:hypothetical protein